MKTTAMHQPSEMKIDTQITEFLNEKEINDKIRNAKTIINATEKD